MTFKEYFNDWVEVINAQELLKITNVLEKLQTTQSIEPCPTNVFKVFRKISLKNVKVIILGQDSYPQKGVATGIAFGNKSETKVLSPSLEILKEACINYEIPHGRIEFDNTLESWVDQGILLLNSALTCETNKPGSHTRLWRPFISSLLSNMSNLHTGCLYVLLGNQAQSFEPFINTKFNTIIKEKHPAYYARFNAKMPNKVFLEITNFVKQNYGENIEWYKEEVF